MADKSLVIQVTVFDPKTNDVLSQTLEVYDGSYGFEVDDTFRKLGERFAKIVDQTSD